MEEWFKSENKHTLGAPMVWKTLVKFYPLVGNYMSWQVGNGGKVKI
jgi:hypothetical protein